MVYDIIDKKYELENCDFNAQIYPPVLDHILQTSNILKNGLIYLKVQNLIEIEILKTVFNITYKNPAAI